MCVNQQTPEEQNKRTGKQNALPDRSTESRPDTESELLLLENGPL